MESQSKAHKSSFEVLEKLRLQHKYTVSAFNNESLELNLYRIEKFKLKRYFSNFFSSCFLGAKKPDLEIYQKVLGITQIRAEHGLLIDDREGNVKTAEECGFQTLHFPEVAGLEEKLINKGIIL
jgi:putative hydrolase of the HAD superfamily